MYIYKCNKTNNMMNSFSQTKKIRTINQKQQIKIK